MEGHFVRFYENEDHLVDELYGYIGRGLDSGDAGIVIVTPRHRELLNSRLNGRMLTAGERYVVLDAADTLARFMVEGMPDERRFIDTVGPVLSRATQAGNGRVRAFGEMVALLVADGREEAAIKLEQLWNNLGRQHTFSLFCAYPMASFGKARRSAAFQRICHEHAGGVCPAESFNPSQSPDSWQRQVAALQQQAAALAHEVERSRQLEQDLKQRLEELAEGARRKDEFLAMLGHELRNPLAPIVTSLELMRLQQDDPRRSARSREIIARQVALMTRLVEDLLDVSRITRGKIELKSEKVSLQGIIERAVEQSRPLIDEQNHRLTIDVPPEPVTVLGDPARLAQVLANLLNNAAKYTENGGAIELRVALEWPNVVVSVRDNGIGMPLELRDRVFDMFFQERERFSPARGGLGLGLTVVRNIVELHGGRVQALSDGPGHGSEFIVRLPLHDPPASIARTEQSAAQPPRARELKILICDDNADAAGSLGDLLRALGHLVRVVNDGASAIEEAQRLRPDAVILDIAMPLMDGYETARRLRTQAGLTSSMIVAVTGFDQERDRSRASDAGFDHHMAKPVDLSRLEALLNGPLQAARAAVLH